MPELVPVWERLVELAGGDEVTAEAADAVEPSRASCPAVHRPRSVLLSPPTAPAALRCSSATTTTAWTCSERVVYSSAFTGRRVLGMGDCLWGLLDGMNDAGLAVSLAFGGRPGSGPGFGIPLVVRYLLEVATSH